MEEGCGQRLEKERYQRFVARNRSLQLMVVQQPPLPSPYSCTLVSGDERMVWGAGLRLYVHLLQVVKC